MFKYWIINNICLSAVSWSIFHVHHSLCSTSWISSKALPSPLLLQWQSQTRRMAGLRLPICRRDQKCFPRSAQDTLVMRAQWGICEEVIDIFWKLNFVPEDRGLFLPDWVTDPEQCDGHCDLRRYRELFLFFFFFFKFEGRDQVSVLNYINLVTPMWVDFYTHFPMSMWPDKHTAHLQELQGMFKIGDRCAYPQFSLINLVNQHSINLMICT